MINFFKFIYRIFTCHYRLLGPSCRIDDIDIYNQTLKVYCRGTDSPLHLRFSELFEDLSVITNLTPSHAALCGFYYASIADQDKSPRNNTNVNFYAPAQPKSSRFRLLAIDRKKNLFFIDEKTKTTLSLSPIKLFLNKSYLNNFPPLQAYHIGVFAALCSNKLNTNNKKHEPVNLKIIH
jgi:hypothetical protein